MAGNPVRQFVIDYHGELFRKHKDCKYPFNSSRDGKAASDIAETCATIERARATLDAFFAARDPWYATEGGFRLSVLGSPNHLPRFLPNVEPLPESEPPHQPQHYTHPIYERAAKLGWSDDVAAHPDEWRRIAGLWDAHKIPFAVLNANAPPDPVMFRRSVLQPEVAAHA
jgi:hypothetical protein